MKRIPIALFFAGVVVLAVGACDDDSGTTSASMPPGSDGGFGVDGSTSGSDGSTGDGSATDGSSGDGCSITGDGYAIYGSQLYKVSADLTRSVLVASITNQAGVPFASSGSSTTGAQVGARLLVSDTNCQFCQIALPPAVVNGVVKAEPVTTVGFTDVNYFWAPSVPDHVIVWNGNGTRFIEWDLAQKLEVANAGIAISGPGVSCTKVYAIQGSISPTNYSVRWLAQCGDGSGPTFATLADSSGSKVGTTWQQDTFQSVASTKGMAQDPQITAADLKRGIYVGAANKVYKESGGTFVPDTTVYTQCNAKTGTSSPGARPLVTAPKG